jgi:hypothetical protein
MLGNEILPPKALSRNVEEVSAIGRNLALHEGVQYYPGKLHG